jgi:hypothetical protein
VIDRVKVKVHAKILKDIENVELLIQGARRGALKITCTEMPEAHLFLFTNDPLKRDVVKVLQDWVDAELLNLEMIAKEG